MTKKPKKTATEPPAKKEPKPEKPKGIEIVEYSSFRMQKRIKGQKITGSFRLMRQALTILGKNWKLFLEIVFWYALLTVALVQGFQTAGTVNDTKDGLEGAFSGGWGDAAASASLFVYFLGSAGDSSNNTAAAYQALLALMFSLILIWVLRQLYTKAKVRIRDGFYMGMSPFVQFILVLVVVALQTIPMVVGATLFSTVFTNGVATEPVEVALWGTLFFILALTSLYMITSSLFALYIVTLPGMTPLAALRSARELVRHRRWAVMRKVVFLPLALIIMAAILTVPLFLLLPPVAAWMLFIISLLLLPVAHSYMYALYRALL